MKTLYINLNGEDVKSCDNIVVVGAEKDSIVNKFYITLGTEICDGVMVKGIKKKQLVTEFESERPQDFKNVLDQWDEIRYKLLSSNPSGEYSVKLSNAYLEWLQYHQNSEYRKIYTQKYSKQKDISVSLDIKQLYEDTIELIISNIAPDDYNKLVVGDDFVTGRSAIVQSIKSEYPKMAFIQYEEFEWPTVFGGDDGGVKEDPEQSGDICPKCGKTPCECPDITSEDAKITEIENGIFCCDDIILGKTTLSDLRKKGYKIHRGFWRDDNMRSYVSRFEHYAESYIVIDNWAYKDVSIGCNYFVNPSVVNTETLTNNRNVITYMAFDWNDCPFLVRLGFGGDIDYNDLLGNSDDEDEDNYDDFDEDWKNEEIARHIVDLFEERGYIQIEPLWDSYDFTLVSKKPNTNGDYIFICIEACYKAIHFYVNIVNEWTDIKTGKHYTTSKGRNHNI